MRKSYKDITEGERAASNMRILVLGATGMLGHKLWQCYRGRFETWAAARAGYGECSQYGLFDPDRFLGGIDAFDFDALVKVFGAVRPDVVVNCIGIIKQLPSAKDPIVSLTINSLFPHRLANLCQATGTRLIHISTDCVFSGRHGMRTEKDISDAEDLYGRTKFLGEVDGPSCLTLRTSIIGRELRTSNGLVEWFLGNRDGAVKGYTRSLYSGFTTLALASIIVKVVEHHPELAGVYQVSSSPISKYELLCLLREAFGLDIEIEPSPEVQIDRTLDSSRFRAVTGFTPPTWPEMIREMALDPTPYERWRGIRDP
jgi:dTDP-4-dehydrorhamnose reductase